MVITNLRMFANKTLLIPEMKRLKTFLDSGGKSQEKKKDRDMGGKRKGLNWVKTEEHTGGQAGRQRSSLRHAGTGGATGSCTWNQGLDDALQAHTESQGVQE